MLVIDHTTDLSTLSDLSESGSSTYAFLCVL